MIFFLLVFHLLLLLPVFCPLLSLSLSSRPFEHCVVADVVQPPPALLFNQAPIEMPIPSEGTKAGKAAKGGKEKTDAERERQVNGFFYTLALSVPFFLASKIHRNFVVFWGASLFHLARVSFLLRRARTASRRPNFAVIRFSLSLSPQADFLGSGLSVSKPRELELYPQFPGISNLL